MYLKSLELQGFKSFPDKIKLEFNKGITAVVGPNGSGKSNIGDAMRWVMGEQSSKTLRGGKMEDVIFSGTESRKQVGYAQVTLTIDNEDRALSVEEDLVSVSRKLYRNGDSEYIINGENCRLKDIVELFMDTGLGRDGYSIIGQGRIADIVSSKSTERREIFEEAAGISKFRYKKEEAERKLVAAEDNIERLNDIIGELEGRITPLKNQSEKAKKFIVLDEQKRDLEISVWVYQLDEYMKNIKADEEKLGLLNEQYSAHNEEYDQIEERIEECRFKRAESLERADKLREKIHQTQLDNSEANSKIAVLENDISHLEDNIEQTREQIEQSKSSKYFLETELSQREKNLTELLENKQNNDKHLAETENAFGEILSKADEFDKSVTDSNNAVNELYLKKSELSFKLENTKNNLDDAQENIMSVKEQIEQAESKERLVAKDLRDMRENASKLDDAKNDSENRLGGYQKLFSVRNEKLESAKKAYNDSDIHLRELRQKLNLLNDLENSMEGFAHSVKSVVKASKQGRISGICGSVAQLLGVDSKYSVAIETALGGQLQNVITDDETAAKRGIKLLKESNSGRATFLPITSVKGKRLEERNLENEDGFIAIACDIVKCESRFEGVFRQLLGRVCIVEDIDLATVIAKKYGYRFKICTLDGQIINAGGSFTGGSVSRSAGILTRKNEIEKISKQVEKLTQDYIDNKEKAEMLSQETAKISADIDGEKEQLAVINNDYLRLEMEIKRASEIRSQLEETLDQLDLKSEEYSKKIVSSQNEIDNIQTSLSKAKEDIKQCEASLSDSQNQQNEYRKRREHLTDELSSVRIKGTEIDKDIEAVKASIYQLESTVANADDDTSKLSELIADCEKQISCHRAEIEKIKQSLEGADDVIAKINDEILSQQARASQYDDSANKLRTEQKIKMEEKENLQGQISRLDEKLKTVNANFDKLVAQLWDDYEMTRSHAQEKAQAIVDIALANRELTEIRNSIKSLGNVNLSSIEEYKEVSERYEFMNTQLIDVKTSKSELEKLIDNLTENMKLIFTENFEKINANFKGIFTELFGGGHANLVLADPENVLECGIDIVVAPPGKVIKNLVSLSGGEQAFVAVAIYFAILKVKPSPFCLLDEIEAALDDVNVTKYAQYLHKFTNTTQFITITHRRGTMEEADVLYGVTMQEKGISKLLKMNISDSNQLKID